MSFWYLMGLAVGLAMDAFAVSVGSCCRLPRITVGHVSRLALSFGFFQFLMPVLGWFAGRGLSRWLGAIDHWVAFGLLAAIGGKMLWDSFRPSGCMATDPTRGWMLLTSRSPLVSTALAVGLSLALLDSRSGFDAVIGVVAAVLTAVGSVFGSVSVPVWCMGRAIRGLGPFGHRG